MQIHNVEQGTDEWFVIRKGKMTASHAQAIGNNGKGLETYITELMAEYYSSGEKEQYSNKHTDRGNELEPIARDIYELETGQTIEKVGFVEYNEFVGCSPDGFISEDGEWECKSIDDVKYFKHLMNGESEIDSAHLWQIQMCLLITGRKYWILTIYNPNFKKSMCNYRIEPDKEKQEALLRGLEIGTNKILEIKQKIYELK